MRRAASLLIALGAAIVELIILAAAGNQWVVDHLVGNARSNELPRMHEFKATLTGFPWRFTSEHGDRMLWLGQLVAAVGLVIVVFLVVWAFVAAIRPPRRFAAVLLGTWGLVLGLTVIAAIGRMMLAYNDVFPNGTDPEGLQRYWYAVFRGPTPEVVLFGAVSGLLVGLTAAIMASITNRPKESDEDLEGMPTQQEQPDTALWPGPMVDEPRETPGYRATPGPRETSGVRQTPAPREAPAPRETPPAPRDTPPAPRDTPTQADTSWRATGTPSWAELASATRGSWRSESTGEPTTTTRRSPFPGDNVPEPPTR